MPIHLEVLRAALRICRARGNWRFRPVDIVSALPDRNPGAVRTHVISRCCINAPRNHPHKWDYFRRVGRGLYEVVPAHRKEKAYAVAERARYGSDPDRFHVVVTLEVRGDYRARCAEVPVDAEGNSLDEVVERIGDAVRHHLGKRRADLPSRLAIRYDLDLQRPGGERIPSWKRPGLRLVIPGASLARAILEERREGR